MSLFLDSVRCIDVLGQIPTPGETTVDVKQNGHTIHISKSDNDSNDAVFAAIPICAIVFTFIYLIVRAIMAPFTNRNKHVGSASMAGGGLSEEEDAALMKLQRTLVQMESRVEALETILIEQSRNKEKYGSKF